MSSLLTEIYKNELQIFGSRNKSFTDKLGDLLKLIVKDSITRNTQQGFSLEVEKAKKPGYLRTYPGPKYVRIARDGSVFVFVEKETGDIFGAKSWRQIHKGHRYGNLDTINDWFWGEYYPQRK